MARGKRKAEPFSIRLATADDEFIKAEAARQRRSRGTVAGEFASEAITMRRYPGIAFRGDGAKRRAWVLGTGLDVWEVIALLRDFGNDQALAGEYDLKRSQIQVASAYYREFPEEIDGWIALGRRSPEELTRDYPFIQPYSSVSPSGA